MDEADEFHVQLSFKGKSVEVSASTATTCEEFYSLAVNALEVDETSTALKLLLKGKRMEPTSSDIVFRKTPKKAPKVLVLATAASAVTELNSKKQDKTIRGFDQEKSKTIKKNTVWGPTTGQDKNYKFCRFEACTWQSFGHRPTDSTPHAFAAMELLEKLATDPGVVAIMRERELVVGTLGEMDPIDDRLMKKKEQESGGCLLGYNTNAGARIDVKLRTDDLVSFRPYKELVSTLIHELSHSWVGEHNLLFWTNFGQMRVEYLWKHAKGTNGQVVSGRTTAQIAGLPSTLQSMKNVYDQVMRELLRDMAQHGLHPSMIGSPIRDRCRELQQKEPAGAKLGGTAAQERSGTAQQNSPSARELALAAAEKRAREASRARQNQRQHKDQNEHNK